jgi:hypothetical protein
LFRQAAIEGTIWARARDARPDRSWVSFNVERAREVKRDCASVPAWRNLVMALGDSGCPDLALIASLRAERLVGSIQDQRMLVCHRNICLLQLGLATHEKPGLIPATELGDPKRTIVFRESVQAWLSRQVRPFEGSLEAAAEQVLEIVVAAADI